ncbi:MAG: nucleotidyltransferase family protein [Terriglobales bacterium]
MKRLPAEDIVAFLSFSSDSRDRLTAVKDLSPREWTRVLQWLDGSGLAFYFLRNLEETNATDAVPSWVLSYLTRNFTDNRERVEAMSRRFAFLNRRFSEAGVQYAVIKGFSLVPEFCPDATLRHQGDLDYLVEGEFPADARCVLGEAGYIAKESRSSTEEIYVAPGGEPSLSARQYSPRAPHAVELHLDIWDSGMHGVPSISNLFSARRAEMQHWNGLTFPALAVEDAFLLQVVHAWHHLFTLWMRMSCLFEIAYFLNRRAGDTELWSRIEECAGDNVVLQEFVVIVSELAARLFASPLPSLVERWGDRIRPAVRTWIEHYARYWAFCELPVYQFRLFPRSKLALFLRQQYRGGSSAPVSSEQNHAPPASRLARIASSIRKEPSLALNSGWWKRQLLVRRGVFHALAGVRYLCEIPRWLWLNQARARAGASSLDGRIRGVLSAPISERRTERPS